MVTAKRSTNNRLAVAAAAGDYRFPPDLRLLTMAAARTPAIPQKTIDDIMWI